jgi:hypothetical protein
MINGQPALTVGDEVVIRMSPQHAKAFAGLMVNQIVAYENQWKVKLPLPPELENVWKEHLKGT